MKRSFGLIPLVAILMPLGCSDNQTEKVSSARTVAVSTTQKASSNFSSTSTAVPPSEIVAMFADSIRRGDRSTVNKLITVASREEIQKQGIELDPPGSPEASYKIGDFRYSDEDKDAGFVESLWIEPAQDGQPPQSTEVVWAVRLENDGWRICGLAIDMGKDQPAALVNFENLEETVVAPPAKQDKLATPTTGSSATPPTQIASPPSSDLRR